MSTSEIESLRIGSLIKLNESDDSPHILGLIYNIDSDWTEVRWLRGTPDDTGQLIKNWLNNDRYELVENPC